MLSEHSALAEETGGGAPAITTHIRIRITAAKGLDREMESQHKRAAGELITRVELLANQSQTSKTPPQITRDQQVQRLNELEEAEYELAMWQANKERESKKCDCKSIQGSIHTPDNHTIKFLQFKKHQVPESHVAPAQKSIVQELIHKTEQAASAASKSVRNALQKTIDEAKVSIDEAKLDSQRRHQENRRKQRQPAKPGNRMVEILDEALDCFDPFYCTPDKPDRPRPPLRDHSSGKPWRFPSDSPVECR